MRTIVFDLDGTLADTSADLVAGANACLTALGHRAALDPASDRATAYEGGRSMLRLGLCRAGLDAEAAAARADSLYPRFLSHYETVLDRETRLFPGVVDALEALAGAGCTLSICTNKPAALAERLVARLGLDGRMAALVGAGTLDQRKPHPAPYHAAVARAGGDAARSLLVGDSRTDRETARAASVPCVLLPSGAAGPGAAALAPEALIDGFGDLPDAVARLLPR